MAWTTQQEARDDLRRTLNDGPKDKLRYRQSVFGDVNGTNKIFKTLEFRRLVTFVSATAPVAVFVNNVSVPVTSDDFENTGEFELTTAPVVGNRVSATFYIQWFTDTEIDEFLQAGANFSNGSDSPVNMPVGLVPAATAYAAGEAYTKLASKFAENLTDTYRLEDKPGKTVTLMDQYLKLAKDQFAKAKKLREDFNTRLDVAKSPISAVNAGRIRDVVPPR